MMMMMMMDVWFEVRQTVRNRYCTTYVPTCLGRRTDTWLLLVWMRGMRIERIGQLVNIKLSSSSSSLFQLKKKTFFP